MANATWFVSESGGNGIWALSESSGPWYFEIPTQVTLAGTFGASGNFSFSSGATGRTVTLTLVNKAESGTALASLTGLRWAFYDTTDPSAWASGPVDKGSGESTDSSGSLVVSLTNTTLSAGQVGWLIVTDSDGTVTQSPVCRSFSAPVTVA